MRVEAFAETVVEGAEAWARVKRPHAEQLCDGHFPDTPLLPGASVVGLMADLAGMLLAKRGAPSRLTAVVSATFLVPILPAADLDLQARLDTPPDTAAAPDETIVSVVARTDGRLAARATLRFA